MSGPIVDMPVHVCRQCLAIWIEDDQMYDNPGRCPRCGAYPSSIAEGDEGLPYV